MDEFVVIVESRADAQTATKLAERILLEQIDWLDREQIAYLFQWAGLKQNTSHSCWQNIKQIIEEFKDLGIRMPKFLGHKGLKADGASATKILRLIQRLQKERNRLIRAVLFIRDIDNQPQRQASLEEAREKHIEKDGSVEIVIGLADRMREAWVLNGFVASNASEESLLQEIRRSLSFDPCIDAHRLRSTSFDEPDRQRNPKVVVEQLTNSNFVREEQCWTETDLSLLRERGLQTGLTAYLHEIEDKLVPILHMGRG